jgi:hypothetical protein
VSARIVSAEEARGLLEGATPGPWWVSNYTTIGSRTDMVAEAVYAAECDRPLLAAAPDLAHTVIALEGERDAALARVARLERVLAVEGGDKAQAPPDWRPTTGGAWNGKEDNYVHRIAAGRWSWVSRDTRNTVRGRGESPSALEAMEAADAAGRWPGDRIHH